MRTRLFIEQLRAEHLPELAMHLRVPEVYEHIGGMPSHQDFVLDREIALLGPSSAAGSETWLNFLVREQATGHMLGRLEATLHDSIAEVAFLFDPKHWGKGFALEALTWLHTHVRDTYGVSNFWATTIQANARCRGLLLRAGYRPVETGAPFLYSYEEADLMFHLRSAA